MGGYSLLNDENYQYLTENEYICVSNNPFIYNEQRHKQD